MLTMMKGGDGVGLRDKVASQFDRRSFRSKPKVISIEDKSQFDRRVNDYKNYSFASV